MGYKGFAEHKGVFLQWGFLRDRLTYVVFFAIMFVVLDVRCFFFPGIWGAWVFVTYGP